MSFKNSSGASKGKAISCASKDVPSSPATKCWRRRVGVAVAFAVAVPAPTLWMFQALSLGEGATDIASAHRPCPSFPHDLTAASLVRLRQATFEAASFPLNTDIDTHFYTFAEADHPTCGC